LKEILDDAAITTVIDVGANQGQFAQDLRKIGFKGKIISFEPGKSAFSILKTKSSNDDLWHCHQYALGRHNKIMSLIIPGDTKLSSLLPSEHVGDVGITEDVVVKRLDEVIRSTSITGIKERYFLKLDTQGFDLEVFNGATEILNEIEGLLSELSVLPIYRGMPEYKEALSAYENAGFALRGLSTVVRNSNKEIVELNAFFTKRR
jgi:FkbM family methyltransferase